ncbi:MAG TPA: Crp/Fnr family transcriptional regulator [Burkholderiales bacterium]|nr:Crp/Fnr family transcriptional regulator [Burkholderiales bacterium]
MAPPRTFRLFRSLADQDVARLLRAAARRKLARGELFVRFGGEVPGICLLVSGSVVLSLGRGNARRVFRVVGPGESFLEAPTISRDASPFEVRALSAAVVMTLPKRKIDAALKRSPRFALDLMSVLAERAMLGMRYLYGTTLSVKARLANHLCWVARAGDSGSWRVVLPATKTILAAQLGMKKESLSRALRALSDAGLIAMDGRRITILNRAALSRAAVNGA